MSKNSVANITDTATRSDTSVLSFFLSLNKSPARHPVKKSPRRKTGKLYVIPCNRPASIEKLPHTISARIPYSIIPQITARTAAGPLCFATIFSPARSKYGNIKYKKVMQLKNQERLFMEYLSDCQGNHACIRHIFNTIRNRIWRTASAMLAYLLNNSGSAASDITRWSVYSFLIL